ncbi:MAG: diguanylate cyclase [Bilophila sp.]
MTHRDRSELHHIPLDSPEALWEWHIPSDKLFLSQGACTALGLFGSHVPTTMTAFLAHIPPLYLPALHENREGVLQGTAGSFLETSYAFGTVLVQERLFVLKRDLQRRATWAMGQYLVTAATEQEAYTESKGAEQISFGYWHCSFTDRTLHLDAYCAALLGYTDGLPHLMALDSWKERMHPDEGAHIACRHKLILEETLMGDILSDCVRIRRENGSYVLLQLQGAVLERDAHGKGLVASGSLKSGEPVSFQQNRYTENGRLLFAINATGDGLWDWDAQTDTVYYSPRYLSMLGYSEEQFPGSLDIWKEKIHPDDHDKIVLPQEAIVASPRYGNMFECTYRIRRADGSWAWILGRGYVTHRDATGKATRIVGMHTDVTTLQTGREELEALIKNDALTGLRSRFYCDMELNRIETNKIRPVSVISCDICGLKLINDYMGHAEGDTLLTKAALMLRHPLRATDCVARTGGDEFVILLPGCEETKALSILEEIRRHFAECNAGNDMPVLVSFGIASTNSPTTPVSRVLIEADKNMLCNKRASRRYDHQRIKAWIEKHTQMSVSLEDERYTC